MSDGRVLIIEENSFVPKDTRVWYEAMTLRDAGWHTTVICPAENGKAAAIGTKENLEGIDVYRFPLKFARRGMMNYMNEYVNAFVSISRLARQVWREGKFDIIHFCNPPDILFPVGLFYRMLGARMVFDHHDLFPELISYRFSGSAGKMFYAMARITEYLTFRSANVVISTNQSYRKIAMERGKVPGGRVFILRNGPKCETFVPVEPVPGLKHGFPYMACYAGVMGFEDGVLEMLASIRHIVCDMGRRDILFTMLGDGSTRPQAVAQVKEWGLESFVHMPGMVLDNLLLRQYLSTADVCLSPEPLTPLNKHSTFIKVAEYMAMGKPIVAYDLPETRFTAQEAAIYVPPGDTKEYGQALAALMDNPAQRQHMGTFGRERILSDLSWEHQKQNLFQAYAAALS